MAGSGFRSDDRNHCGAGRCLLFLLGSVDRSRLELKSTLLRRDICFTASQRRSGPGNTNHLSKYNHDHRLSHSNVTSSRRSNSKTLPRNRHNKSNPTQRYRHCRSQATLTELPSFQSRMRKERQYRTTTYCAISPYIKHALLVGNE